MPAVICGKGSHVYNSPKILYTANGGDPNVISWPPTNPDDQKFIFTSGQVMVVQGLIGYGDGSITYADGRVFPSVTPQGSTFVHQTGA